VVVLNILRIRAGVLTFLKKRPVVVAAVLVNAVLLAYVGLTDAEFGGSSSYGFLAGGLLRDSCTQPKLVFC
jgi:hypothetical protein